MKLIKWISALFEDERGEPSSKRFVGILSALLLIIVFTVTVFNKDLNAPSETLIDSITLLAVGGLGFSSVDKFWSSKNNIKRFKDKDDDDIVR